MIPSAVLSNSILTSRVTVVLAILLGLPIGPKDLSAQSSASLQIRSQALSVTLDARFPRVFKYETASGKSLPAALESSRPRIKLNEQLFTAGDLSVSVQSTPSSDTFA